MSDQIEGRTSSCLKREKNSEKENLDEQFLLSYEPEDKFHYENFDISDKKIGTGLLSKIYLATNKIDSLQYAVKKINKKKVLNNGISLEIIKNEIEIHERILHPNIVRMYSHYEDENNFYCFLEYINGQSLLKFMEDKKKGLSERETCKLFNQIIKSIKFLHSNKIIHRNIKLENFLIKNNDIVKLIDFGCCAILTDEEPKRMSTCGTYLYMSPELINLSPYDYCVDIWALGVLLFELLEGYSPFGKRDDNHDEIYSNILTKKFKVNKELSNNCLDLLNKMLENDCEKRININGIFNHPWIKDWSIDKSEGNLNIENFENKNKDDEDFFNNVLNQVEKKNKKRSKKNSKKKNTTAENVKYEKKKIDFSNDATTEENEENNNNTEEKIENIEKEEEEKFKKKEEEKFEDIKNEEKKEEEIIEDFKKEEKKEIKKNEEITLNEEEKEIKKNIKIVKDNFENELDINFFDNKSIDKKDKKDFLNDTEEFSTRNLLDMIDNNHMIDIQNSLSSDSDEINTNKSFMEKLKEKKKNTHYYLHTENLNRIKEPINLIPKFEDTNNLENALAMFAKADSLKKENNKKIKKEKGFWEKLFAPFKCGETNS